MRLLRRRGELCAEKQRQQRHHGAASMVVDLDLRKSSSGRGARQRWDVRQPATLRLRAVDLTKSRVQPSRLRKQMDRKSAPDDRVSEPRGAGAAMDDDRESRAWTVDESVSANEENELATIRVRTMYG